VWGALETHRRRPVIRAQDVDEEKEEVPTFRQLVDFPLDLEDVKGVVENVEVGQPIPSLNRHRGISCGPLVRSSLGLSLKDETQFPLCLSEVGDYLLESEELGPKLLLASIIHITGRGEQEG
jgi:hypothetical protein